MGKISLWFGGGAVTFLGLYLGSLSITDRIPSWLSCVLFYIFLGAGILFLLTGFTYLFQQIRKRLNPLDILDNIRCTYWPKQKQLEVVLWFGDYSNSPSFKTSCVALFGEQLVNVTGRKEIGGTYFNTGNASFKSGRSQPIMAEFHKDNIEITKFVKAVITVKMKPSGIWATKKKTKMVTVQVVN